MRIAILGASGRTGVHAVKHALANGHDVTAFARTPAKIGMAHARLKAIALDLSTADAEQAMTASFADTDAVISTLGPDKPGNPAVMAIAAERLIAAAKRAGVKRIIWMTGAAVKLPGDAPSAIRTIVRGIMKLVAGAVLADSEKAARAVAASGLDWTLVRAPMLNDDPPSGRLSASDIPPRPAALSRDEIAAFLIDCAERNLFVEAAPFLSLGEAK